MREGNHHIRPLVFQFFRQVFGTSERIFIFHSHTGIRVNKTRQPHIQTDESDFQPFKFKHPALLDSRSKRGIHEFEIAAHSRNVIESQHLVEPVHFLVKFVVADGLDVIAQFFLSHHFHVTA